MLILLTILGVALLALLIILKWNRKKEGLIILPKKDSQKEKILSKYRKYLEEDAEEQLDELDVFYSIVSTMNQAMEDSRLETREGTIEVMVELCKFNTMRGCASFGFMNKNDEEGYFRA